MKTLTAIDLLNDKRDGLKQIIDAGRPYEALQLISLHIEFMGKLLDRLQSSVSAAWNVNRKEPTFENVCAQLKAMREYDPKILQNHLRNGLVHNGVPKENLLLTHIAAQSLNKDETIILNINTLYADFSAACDELIAKIQEYNTEHPHELETSKKFPQMLVGAPSEFK